MKIQIVISQLMEVLTPFRNVIKKSNDITGCIRIICNAKSVTFTGLSSSSQLSINLPCEAENISKGTVIVPFDNFFRLLSEMNQKEFVSLESKDSRLLIVQMVSRYSMPIRQDVFPSFEYTKGKQSVFFDSSLIHSMISKVQYAMGKQDVREYLNSVHFLLEGGQLTVEATDGHRLAQQVLKTDQDIKFDSIVSAEVVRSILDNLPATNQQVKITPSDTAMKIEVGSRTLVTKLIDGRYPDTSRLISTSETVLSVHKEEFAHALRRVVAANPNAVKRCQLEGVDDRLKFSLSQQMTKAESGFFGDDEVQLEGLVDDFTIGFNADYLLSLTKVIEGDKIKFSQPVEGSPAMFTSELSQNDLSEIHVIASCKL